MLKQSFSITNLTRDGIILLEENIKEEIFVQIKKIEEIKRDKDNSTPKNKYYKYFFSCLI